LSEWEGARPMGRYVGQGEDDGDADVAAGVVLVLGSGV
jgi:hypothetical protein